MPSAASSAVRFVDNEEPVFVEIVGEGDSLTASAKVVTVSDSSPSV